MGKIFQRFMLPKKHSVEQIFLPIIPAEKNYWRFSLKHEAKNKIIPFMSFV